MDKKRESILDNVVAPAGEDLKKKKKGKKKGDDEKDDKPQLPPVPYFTLFRYVSTFDIFLVLAGTLAAAASGLSMPLIVIYFGRMMESMVASAPYSEEDYVKMCSPHWPVTSPPPPGATSTTTSSTTTPAPESLTDTISEMAIIMSVIGAATWVLNLIFISAFNIVAENQVYRIRKLYLEALLRQNVGWYDTVEDKNFVSRISEDLVKLKDGISEKVGLCIFFTCTFLFSLGNAFWHGWKLTLVVLSSAPVLTISTMIVAGIQTRMAKTEQDSYAKAAKIAEEAITNVKTVMAFSGAGQEVERYEKALGDSKVAARKKGAFSSFGMGLMWLIIYCAYALAFWYGTKLILDGRPDLCNGRDPEYSAENMIIVFFSVMMGAFNIGQSASYFEAFATARGAASGIFTVIDRTPEIDSYSEAGKRPSDRARGNIEFKDVRFHYPSRPDVQILKGFNLSVKPGQTVALVGHSGCGKSTCIQLLQRFYDPLGGAVILDGHDIKDLHIGWLRSQIGVVSQEPILFNTTIAENIRYGNESVTQKEIEEACRQSNAHAFISKLPNKYETLVGDRGAALSGGQKQRIAIARSLVRNPAILLLDEATSALDTQSESIVQAALDKASQGRTTLIVAHRLSTIRNADLIVAVNNGQVVEQGTHSELVAKKGLYHSLVTAQMQGLEEEEEPEGEEAGAPKPKRRWSRQLSHQDSKLSVTSPEEEFPEEELEEELSDKELQKEAPTLRLMKLNIEEWPFILIGTIAAAIQGSVMPIYAIIFGDVMQTFSEPDEDKAEKDANKYALYFVGIGLIAGISMFVQMLMFNFAGDALTHRLRKLTFSAMLKQELGWFDNPGNNIGALCSRLAGDAASVQGATGSQIGMIVQAVSTITIAIGVAMYYEAKLGGVALAFAPVVLIGTYFQGMLLFGVNLGETKALDASSKIAVQAVSNIRTVASLSKERMFVKMYNDLLVKAHNDTFRINLLRGFIFGMSNAVPNFAYAAVNYYGAYLVDNEGMEYGNIFKVSQSLILGTMMVGQALSFQPNYSKAVISGARVLRLLDRRPKIDTSLGVGLQIKSSNGEVKFQKVAFHYPTRPSAKILRSLSLAVESGQSVALVGPSGCGKSTTIQLALRYYDPLAGTVYLDEHDTQALQVESLRKQMAIVAQEPSLFDRTIAENIAYGDNSRTIPMTEIISAAKNANIHNFIAGLPAGYETRVGEMGTQLSGGQKQRVAIARALVRNPKILLLDEATSALDTESEKVVQEALDQASSGRTSITIAHRLSSIQNSDKIIVINHGEVVEEGPHKQLLEKRGLYHRLWNMQGGRKEGGHGGQNQ